MNEKSTLTIRVWLELDGIFTGPFRSAREAAYFRKDTPGFTGAKLKMVRTGR